MGHINAIISKSLFKLFNSALEFFYFLLSAFPSIFLVKHLVDIEILSYLSSNYTMGFIKLCFDILGLKSKLHNFLLILGATWVCTLGVFYLWLIQCSNGVFFLHGLIPALLVDFKLAVELVF